MANHPPAIGPIVAAEVAEHRPKLLEVCSFPLDSGSDLTGNSEDIAISLASWCHHPLSVEDLSKHIKADGMTRNPLSESSFREMVEGCLDSVWTLELLLLLFTHPDRTWTALEMVRELRSSDLVVAQSVQCLLSAGLVVGEGDGSIRYAAASADLNDFVAKLDHEYRTRPTQIRRMIIGRSNAKLTAFSDAFLLRRPPK